MELRKAVDNLCIYDPEFDYIAERFVSDVGTNSEKHSVRTMDDLKDALNSYFSVKFLEVCLHGSPGMIYLNDKTAVVGSYINKLVTNANFLQKESRILFDSCSIGAGDPGENFLDSLGSGLLMGKGGIAGATTVDNVVSPLFSWTSVYMKPLSFGRLKVYRYDVMGNRIGERTVDRHGLQR